MQKLWPFYRDIKYFCKKHQNSCLLFFLLTRSHNITKSVFSNFFQTFYHFLLFFRRLKRRPTGGGCGGWKKIWSLPVAHHIAHALQVNFQILNILPPIQKCLQNFLPIWNFFKKKKIPPFQRCGSHILCVTHIQYAPLIFWLSVTHISICATHIPITPHFL
jgi:hypothetical protein